MNHCYLVPLERVAIHDRFWKKRIDQILEEIIPYQWNALNDNLPGVEPSHAVENFRIAAGLSDGQFHGMRFQDSDVAKWLEAASYSLTVSPNPGLEKIIDDLIDVIAAAQQKDGYLNTYFTVALPDKRWTDFSHGHELYCAGHLIEAATAYYNATGKRKLLDIVCRYADYIDKIMGPEENKRQVYCGHEEIELALIKLYQVTGQQKYLKLSEYFINERGKQPCFLSDEETFGFEAKDRWFGLDYHQAHTPVREQTHAEGHAVRAMYLYAAMTDIALETGDHTLFDSLKKLWGNVVDRRMYITGGIGSQAHGERFTFDYDLPNDVAYAETCASIGLVLWAARMLRIERNGIYADVMERAMYNGVLSGISLDGTKYFYVNPLEVDRDAVSCRYDHQHVAAERVHWFGCACCPPNIARLLSSLGQYLYTQDDEGLQIHLYMGNEAKIEISGQEVIVEQKTAYPWNGEVDIMIRPERSAAFTVFLRIPVWCKDYTLSVNGNVLETDGCLENGYVRLERNWNPGDRIALRFSMPVEKMRSHPQVRENAGKIAFQRGPLVYCLEEEDNGKSLMNLTVSQDARFEAFFDEELLGGICVLTGEAQRMDESSWLGGLYRSENSKTNPVRVKAIPYSVWGNRTPGEMAVWIRESPTNSK